VDPSCTDLLTPPVTVYDIRVDEGVRGSEVATDTLGADVDEIFCGDGWSAYRTFKSTTHQTSFGHLLEPSREPTDTSGAGQARIFCSHCGD